jgi:hypothetical protein
MTTPRGIAVGALALALLLAPGSTADAFVRTRSSKGVGIPAYWPGACVFIKADAAGSPDLTPDQTFTVIQRSMSTWENTTAGCSYLKLMFDATAALETHYDNDHVIKFRTETWCHPDDKQHKDVCYDAQAAAITSVFMINDNSPEDGLILDADIEMNNINFTFVVVEAGVTPMARPGTSIADLENTLTHELGHLLGLSHTCKDAASFANDVDQNGNVPPACDAIPDADKPGITNATMYNFAAPGETKKRSPSDDDIAGVCNAYPLAKIGGRTCERTDVAKLTRRGGCDVSRRGAAEVPIVLVAGALASALLLGLLRRRRS